MLRTIPSALLCWLFLLAPSQGQDVFVPRELKAVAVTASEKERASRIEKVPPANEPVAAKQSLVTQPAKTMPANEPAANPRQEKTQAVKEADKVAATQSKIIQFQKAESGKKSAVNLHS